MDSYVHFPKPSPLRPGLDLTGLPQGAFFVSLLVCLPCHALRDSLTASQHWEDFDLRQHQSEDGERAGVADDAPEGGLALHAEEIVRHAHRLVLPA